MGFLGRESQRDAEKKEQWKQWITARPPLAIFALAAALLSLIDSPIMVLSLPAGVAAIVMSIIGLRRFGQDPHKVGRGSYKVAIVVAVLGMTSAILMWQFMWPALARQAGQ